jgi:hypothetical protein
MNTRSNHNPAILMAFIILLAIACISVILFLKPTPSPLPTATMEPKLLHFENDFVAFDYPAGMVVFNAADPAFIPYPSNNRLGGQLVAGLADPEEIGNNGALYRTLGIFRHPIPPGSNLEKVMEQAYNPVDRTTGYVDATGPVRLAGLSAYQQTYSYFDSGSQAPYEMRDIWAEKDNMIFRVSIWTPPHNPENFAAFQSLADKIINSLVIKDNLPPILETPTPEPTPSPTPFPASMIAHFENDVVAFDYLKTMKVHTANDPAFQCYPDFQLSGELIVGLGDPNFTGFDNYYRSIRIFRQQIPAGSNLEAIMLDAYRLAEKKLPHEKGILNASGPITVDGLPAVQRTYRVTSGEPAYEMRDIWIQKGNELFILAIWTEYTNPADFAAFQAGADMLLESLRIK